MTTVGYCNRKSRRNKLPLEPSEWWRNLSAVWQDDSDVRATQPADRSRFHDSLSHNRTCALTYVHACPLTRVHAWAKSVRACSHTQQNQECWSSHTWTYSIRCIPHADVIYMIFKHNPCHPIHFGTTWTKWCMSTKCMLNFFFKFEYYRQCKYILIVQKGDIL